MKGEDERVGFILPGNKVVEVKNHCDKPTEGFSVSGADILKYIDTAIGTWHTHPGASSNLSPNDYESFVNFPNLEHFIVGMDGVTKYLVHEGRVVVA